MKKNIRDKWWKTFIEERSDCLGIETPIIMHNQGTSNLSDLLFEKYLRVFLGANYFSKISHHANFLSLARIWPY